jgi:hypothetical protein
MIFVIQESDKRILHPYTLVETFFFFFFDKAKNSLINQEMPEPYYINNPKHKQTETKSKRHTQKQTRHG